MWSFSFSGGGDGSDDVRPARRAAGPWLDAARFRAAFEEHAPAVLRYARSRVGWPAAEEVLAATFEQAWKSRDRYEDPDGAGLEAWLIGITTIVVRRFRHAERRWLGMCADAYVHGQERPEQDTTARLDEQVDASARAQRLAAALSRIPRREREVLLLHVLQELGYEQIAQVLDMPIGTVRSRISRGRARLAERMGGEHD